MQARGPSSPSPCVHWARGVGEHFVIFAPCQRDCTRPLLQGDKSLHLFVVCYSLVEIYYWLRLMRKGSTGIKITTTGLKVSAELKLSKVLLVLVFGES